MLLAVAPTKFAQGIDATKEGRAAAPEVYTCTHLDTMLRETYPTDAHFVAYVCHDEKGSPLATQPRINKGGITAEHRARVYCLVVDVDNVGHAKWSSDQAAIEAVDRVAKLVPTAAVYATSGGMRVVQPLTRALEIDEAEGTLDAWIGELARRGVNADPRCRDWTRHFRAPNVLREGKRYKSPAIARRFEQVAAPSGPGVARRSRRALGKEVEVVFAKTLPADVERIACELTIAAAPHLASKGSRHTLALALSGAMLKRGVRAEYVPAIIARIFAPHSSDLRKRIEDAETTCRRFMGRLPVDSKLSGRADAHWPGLELHVLSALGQCAPPAEEPTETIETVTGRLLQLIRQPGDGVTLIKAQCGLGKTRALRVVAAERSRMSGKFGRNVAISVPTTELAKQVQRDLAAEGVAVRRVFGPLSAKGPNDRPVCKYVAVGAGLARGGLSVAQHLCKGCDVRETCAAKDGVDGPDNASVSVGPHELVAELAEYAGKTGLLGIDEPPALVDVETLTCSDLLAAELVLHWFEPKFRAAMAPILRGSIAWLARGIDPEPGPISRGLTEIDPSLEDAAFEATGGTSVAEWAEAARGDRKGTTPPLDRNAGFRLRHDPVEAGRVGEAARVLGLLLRAALDHKDVSASVEDHPVRGGAPIRRIVLTAIERRMMRALEREGSTLVMAADADVFRPLIVRAVGYAPALHAFAAPEVQVDRLLVRTPGATRTGWLDGGIKEDRIRQIARAIERVVAWALEVPSDKPLAIVSYKRVADSLRAALGRKAHDPHEGLRDALAPILARLPVPPEVGHYGALRGLDLWKELDALATVGDPYPSIGTLERQESWIRSGPQALVAPEDWPRAHAAAELEQAHGRLRTVHRARPARQLHVGRVVPAGWRDVRIEDAPEGRPRGVEIRDVAQLVERAGGCSSVARGIGVDARTVRRWVSGERRPPPAMAWVLERLGGES